MAVTVFGVLFFVIGLYFVYDGLHLLWKELQIRSGARQQDGVVVSVKKGTYNPRVKKYHPYLEFDYGGERKRCKSIRTISLGKSADGFHDSIKVYYNPKLPEVCSHGSIVGEIIGRAALIFAGGLMACTGLYLML